MGSRGAEPDRRWGGGATALRHPRSRRGDAGWPFLHLAAHLGRVLTTGSLAAVRKFLLRGIREQLCRPCGRKAVPGVLQLSRRGSERYRRTQLREVAARV